ncbi:MAG: hypothetical protein ACHQ9S_05975 [Candidatus Binatia bacterium]
MTRFAACGFVSLVALTGTLSAALALGDPAVRLGEVVRIAGADIGMLRGYRIDQLTLVSCVRAACRAIPFQIDERDAMGNWVLDQGPEVNAGQASGVLDHKALLLFMAADAGDQVRRADLPGSPAAEIAVHDPLLSTTCWAYLVAFPHVAPRSEVSYVRYDPANDRVGGRRVSLGFNNGVPDHLAVTGAGGDTPDGPNLLDRLKVRATATFLWGLIRFSRDESDLRTEFVAWRQGPIRVIRRQRQWVRIGWGIRSPTFGSYTYFYRDFAELPVSLRLNFPPHYFFGGITVRAVLDFRDLRGWSVLTPSLPAPITIDGTMTKEKAAVNDSADSWFALRGAQITLVQTMDVSPSLATVRRRLLYRESAKPSPPEAVPGEEPGVGFNLDRWEQVGAGLHQLESVSYALPPEVDARAFMAARSTPLQVTVQPPRD